MDLPPFKIKSKRHIKNRYIGNFMHKSFDAAGMGGGGGGYHFKAHPLQWPLKWIFLYGREGERYEVY
jgi:hypothetical protein